MQDSFEDCPDNFSLGKESTMVKHILTPIKAIRDKCKDCTCHQLKEIMECEVLTCALWPYRMGRRPDRKDLDLLTTKGINQDAKALVR